MAARTGAGSRKGLSHLRRPLAGLGERSKPVSEALTTAARAWASDKARLEDDRGRAKTELNSCADRMSTGAINPDRHIKRRGTRCNITCDM